MRVVAEARAIRQCVNCPTGWIDWNTAATARTTNQRRGWHEDSPSHLTRWLPLLCWYQRRLEVSGEGKMSFAELFAGAGGLSLGLERAGWSCAWHSEIADFPCRVLRHRWPEVPLYGDVARLDGRTLVERHGPIDLLSGGSPCQDLSVAGKRRGMAEGSGTRSSLFYEQLRIWNETNAEFLLWENVDGARSSNEGKDFGCVLSAIVGASVAVPTDGWRSGGVAVGPSAIAAWRVLDAQFFGVPQRRRRIFILSSRTGRVDPAEVLSLSEGLQGNPTPGGEAREGFTDSSRERIEADGGVRLFAIAHGEARESEIASCIPANSGPNRHGEGSHSATQFDAVLAFAQNQRGELRTSEVSPSLNIGGGKPGEGYPAVLAFDERNVTSPVNRSNPQPGDPCATLHKPSDMILAFGMPRRLTPLECERLQGWPDNWTNVPDKKGKPASDAARYKAIGNGVASPVVEWIGQRLLAGSA